jgi:hypothetical protein
MTKEAADLEQEAERQEARIQQERRMRQAVETDLVRRLELAREQEEAIRGVDEARTRRWSERLEALAGMLDGEAPGVWLTGVRCETGADGETLEILGRSAAPAGSGREPASVTPAFAEALARTLVGEGAGPIGFDGADELYVQERLEEPGTEEGASDAFRMTLRRGTR